MQGKLFTIESRYKAIEVSYAIRADFTTSGEVAAPAATVLEPGWSPYCLDPALGEMVFVHLPPGIDLSEAVFYCLTQYRKADRLMTLPLTALAGLTRDLPVPELVWIFSTGRCGTTLASHVLNGSDDVWSLSEPAVFDTRALRACEAAGTPQEQVIGEAVKLLFAGAPAGRSTLALKLRSQALFHADRFHAATPTARFIFMYRDAIGWIASFHQFLQGIGVADILVGEELLLAWGMMSADSPIEALRARIGDIDQLGFERLFAIGWIVHLEAYGRALAAGVPFATMRYNELKADPAGATAKLFQAAGLSPAGIAKALTAFDRDSQEGTVVARDANRRRMTVEHTATALAVLAADPAFADPNLILPDAVLSERA